MIRACMVVFSHYPADPRVRREAEALADEGTEVDVVCLAGPGAPRRETVRGVRVFRLPVTQRRGGKLRYLWEYASFLLMAFCTVSWLHLVRRYRLVHVHNMPDVLVFTALLPRLTGAKVVLDLHDPMPEVFMTKYGLGANHPVLMLLRLLERCSIAMANLVLTPNISFQNLFVSRGCPERKIAIVMNSPQETVFRPAPAGDGARPGGDGRRVLMYHGTIVERHGLDTALEALDRLREELPGISFQVYGDGDFVEAFQRRVGELRLEGAVAYHGRVSLERIAAAIPAIDVGVIPNKRSVFTDLNLPTRIFEYLAMGKPVVAPRTHGVRDYFDENSLFLFEPGDAGSLAAAIRRALAAPERERAVIERGQAVYRRHRWEVERRHFVNRLSLLARGAPG
ncbi:MAG TPA: glycosyltransferase family 4 protein [Planctomycetota bacterium]|nr:glycosyltransferase family 4 protein [Planctomycetota bacterium]